MFPLGSNISIATNFDWNRQDWNSPSMDLTAFYRMQRSSFLPYLSAYHPYNNFSIASYQSCFRFQHYFRSQLTADPYSTFNYYKCLNAKNLYESLFGKHYIYYIKYYIYLFKRYLEKLSCNAILVNNLYRVSLYYFLLVCFIYKILDKFDLNFFLTKILREKISII